MQAVRCRFVISPSSLPSVCGVKLKSFYFKQRENGVGEGAGQLMGAFISALLRLIHTFRHNLTNRRLLCLTGSAPLSSAFFGSFTGWILIRGEDYPPKWVISKKKVQNLLTVTEAQRTPAGCSTPSPCVTLEQEEPFVEPWTNNRRPLPTVSQLRGRSGLLTQVVGNNTPPG